MSNLKYRLEKRWSCPVHDSPVSHKPLWDEDWNDGATICLDCLFGSWQVVKDEEGWATMTVSSKTTMDLIFEQITDDLRRDLNRESLLLKELK